MIRYPTRTEVIERLVRMRQPGWQTKAAVRTNYHAKAQRFIKSTEYLPDGKKATEFWGEIKSIFITIQHKKCAYCETKLEDSAIEWDLEHFRPKSEVSEWIYKGASTGAKMPEGYYLLAYHLDNYVVSCKTCNTTYKGTKFPIAYARVKCGKTVAEHASEGAYLIFPLGDFGEDPAQYITFDGVQAIAKNRSERGQLIIDFFDLNRQSLQNNRAEWLVRTFWPNFRLFLQHDTEAETQIKYLCCYKAPYANCTRAFYDFCMDHLINDRTQEVERQYAKIKRITEKTPKK